jgi:arylsulfatase A
MKITPRSVLPLLFLSVAGSVATPEGEPGPSAAPPLDEPLRVLLLGDSISIGYTPGVREILGDRAVVVRPMRAGGERAENCEGTAKGIDCIERWIAIDGGGWDVIHFNFGLHDLKHVDPETGKNSNDRDHPRQAPPDRYEEQLRRIVASLETTGARLIFATTTPVPEERTAPERTMPSCRVAEDVEVYNDIARRIVGDAGIPINDLFGFALPRLSELQKPRNVHFTPAGSRALAGETASAILRAAGRTPEADSPPNVVLILADDLGYGDVHALNPSSQCSTPNLDRLAGEGMAFDDAHSPSGVCTPTRYGVLTGRYCWRSSLKSGVLGGYSPPLLGPAQPTIGTLLQEAGYRTGAVGKWHLGMELPKLAADTDTSTWSGDPGIDFSGVITDGPTHHGFDTFFGVTASLDMAPYVYVRDDHFAAEPTMRQEAMRFPHFVREGPRSIDFRLENVLDDLTREAVSFIGETADDDRPFFLYLALTAPHKPTLPHDHFRGRSGLGEYGDFIEQVDWTIGRVMAALEDRGVAEHTLVIFTSDNGSYMHRLDDREDPATHPEVHGYHPSHHRPNGPWRGTKADIYEAGHRVPFLVRWPGEIARGSRSSEPICHVDLLATIAAATGGRVADGGAEDSISLLPLFRGEEGAHRGVPVVHHSSNGTFALREGRWKAIFSSGSGGRERPVGKPFDAIRLFDLEADPGETTDVAEQHPEIIDRLEGELRKIRVG